jgi:hypothetical protein
MVNLRVLTARKSVLASAKNRRSGHTEPWDLSRIRKAVDVERRGITKRESDARPGR